MIVDAHVYLSRWPTRRLPDDEPPRLAERLRRQGVEQAWAGTFDALLHHDLAAANARLATTCREQGNGLFLPFGAINPKLPGWREDLRQCVEVHGMRGIRLHPNYHDYNLEDPGLFELLSAAQERRVVVQLAVAMEDDRTQHRLLRVPAVDLKPLPAILKQLPSLRVVLLNASRTVREEQLADLAAAGLVYVELATLEGVAGVSRLLKLVPLERILFGSYAPFYYFESARLKLQESELAGFQREAIESGNAKRILGPV